MQAVSKLIFGPTQEERVKSVQAQLRSEQRALDREVRQIDAASSKAKMEVKKLAKKGDTKNARILAREIVRSRKQKDRLITSKAQLNSINMQLGHQLAMYKVTGSMQKSTEIMKMSNQLVKLPEVSKVMREMSAEMTKAGIMEEILEDTLDSSVLGEEDDLEEEATGEVDKVLFELTDGKLGQAAGTEHLPDLVAPKAAEVHEDEEKEQENLERMQAALDGLLRG
ncbi:Snf7-domain-containing protein [Ceraceosorus guamensis]|uniref:Snf7-domain-containing protein n=1 Tax=Ceraceosorus guamensis TaxID=1522189 RepID=A0A316W7I4_9BASI|nr:Snf7-domain-containing protein [Ceraceosorus guamensis]PWN44033.1 Snf7-domain-containing protein [Ceraceosorus guamensis]